MLHTFMIGHDLSIFGSNSTPSQKNMFVVLPVPFLVSQAPGLFLSYLQPRSLSNRGWVCLDIRSSAMSRACLNGHTMPGARVLRRPPETSGDLRIHGTLPPTLNREVVHWLYRHCHGGIFYIYIYAYSLVCLIIFMIIYACYMYEYIYIINI